MASSKIQICSMAHSLLKASGSIMNLNEPTNKAERIFAMWYESVYIDTLCRVAYNDSIRRRTITADPNAPKDFTYSHKWKLPSECVHLIGVGDLTQINDYGYVVEDGYLCLKHGFERRKSEIVGNPDAFDINIRYVYRIPEEKVSAKFAMLMSYALAACPGIATELTDNEQLISNRLLMYAQQEKKFMVVNKQETKVMVVRNERGRVGSWRKSVAKTY